MNLKEIKNKLRQFSEDREWDEFHNPKNLSMALSVEVSELVEIFQWLTIEESKSLNKEQNQAVKEELADIFIYLIRIADKLNINLEKAVEEKVKINAKKYPINKDDQYINNETLGQTAEKVICDLSNLDATHLLNRSNPILEKRILPLIKKALNKLPNITRYAGLESGKRGGQSKSTVDFYANDKTISVKTTKNKSFKLCPSECGQPGNQTFDLYFGHLYEGSINNQKCKELVVNKINHMIPIYIEHLFDCDFLLLIYINSPNDGFYIYDKNIIKNIHWEAKDFTFTRGLDNWNESTTVKYRNISIGEFQIHSNRNCYKFRFHILNLSKFIFNVL